MFKKIYQKIDAFESYLRKQTAITVDNTYTIRGNLKDVLFKLDGIPSLVKAQNIIDSQQRTIEQLTNALMDKYEHGLFIFSEDGRNPMVIRNGKELTNKMTTYFDISWKPGEIPCLTIEQHAGTYYDMEV